LAVTIKNKLQKSAVTIIAAAPAPAIAGNALEVEDEFTPYYNAEGGGATGHILKPPYDPRQLEKMTQENNTLGPCIEAMVVNIDGTGHEIEKIDMNPDEDEEEEEDPVALRLEAFFKEPYPGVSFMTIRRDLRRDLERTGNGYLEVLRNIVGQIVFLRHVPARTIRLVKLDKAISAKKTVKRNGEDVTFNVMVRERRYVQLMSGQLLFFREFGSTRDLDKKKGKWGTPMSPVAPDKRATELIHFQVGQDPNSPYGVPRWEGAIPSVLGSREAEETNLTYLKTGGLPPALIMVQGGMMAEEAKRSITEQFSPGHKMRAAIVEVASTEGSMDKPGSVKVSVERFGSENMKDSMFEGYDANCKERVLHCFRIPPMFIGDAASHNFATAYASYITAEAQVFGPEREHFDEVMTMKLLPALGGSGYKFKSKPITIKDATAQVAGIGEAAGIQGADPKSLIDNLNDVLDLNIEFSEEQQQNQLDQQRQEAAAKFGGGQFGNGGAINQDAAAQKAGLGAPRINPATGAVTRDPPKASPMMGQGLGVVKSDNALKVMELADRLMVAMRVRKADDVVTLLQEANTLPAAEKAIFDRTLAYRQFLDPSADPEGLASIAGCTVALIQNHVMGS
jgi:PBSX family phage portal protein